MIISWSKSTDSNIWRKLESQKFDLSLAIGVFGSDGCPASPTAQEKLFRKLTNVLRLNPKQIWLDHFRFDGHWESIIGNNIPEIHQNCQWCRRKNRLEILKKISVDIASFCQGKTSVGYFAVPFRPKEVPQLITGLGQDHSVLGKIFDLASPMLYHRMIKKPTAYISQYVNWLANVTQKPVLPIIQVRNEPPDLKDTLTEEEITQAFKEAAKFPSQGVSFFWWTAALETNKRGVIKKLFATLL